MKCFYERPKKAREIVTRAVAAAEARLSQRKQREANEGAVEQAREKRRATAATPAQSSKTVEPPTERGSEEPEGAIVAPAHGIASTVTAAPPLEAVSPSAIGGAPIVESTTVPGHPSPERKAAALKS